MRGHTRELSPDRRARDRLALGARWGRSEAPVDRVLRNVRTQQARAQRISEVAAERRVPGADALQSAADLVGHRLAHPLSGIAGLARSAAKSVGTRELARDPLDLVAREGCTA